MHQALTAVLWTALVVYGLFAWDLWPFRPPGRLGWLAVAAASVAALSAVGRAVLVGSSVVDWVVAVWLVAAPPLTVYVIRAKRRRAEALQREWGAIEAILARIDRLSKKGGA